MTTYASLLDGVRRCAAVGLTLVCGLLVVQHLASPLHAATIVNGVALRHAPPTHLETQEVSALQSFLVAGPTRWARGHAPKFPAGLSLTNRSGVMRDDAVNQFLEYKRDLNPTRFDLRHPRIAPLFQQQSVALSRVQAETLAASSPQAVAAGSQIRLAVRPAPLAVETTAVPVTTTSTTTTTKTTVTTTKAAAADYDGTYTIIIHEPANSAVVTPAAETLETAPVFVPEPSGLLTVAAVFAAALGWSRRRRGPQAGPSPA